MGPDLTRKVLGRLRRECGWFTRLTLPPCTECGTVVVGPSWQKRHRGCVRAFKTRQHAALREITRLGEELGYDA